MDTSTFDRDLTLKNSASVKKFYRILNSDTPKTLVSEHPYSEEERRKSEALLRKYLYRSET